MSLTSCLPSNAAFLIIFLTCQSIFTFLLFLQEFLQLLICLQGLVLLMNIMLTFSSASDKSSEIQVRSQQVWIEICAELSTNRISQATHCCLCLQRVPQDSITMQINKQHLWAILFPMPCKEMCRQGQYGPSLVLWQKTALFGAEINNFIFFLVFFWVPSPVCPQSMSVVQYLQQEGLTAWWVTWYTEYPGFMGKSQLDVLRGWFSVIIGEIFAFVSLAVLQCDQEAGTGLAIHSESLSPTQRKVYLDLTLKFSNLTNQHFKWRGKKMKCLSKASWPEIWISSDLGRDIFLRSCRDMT